VTSVWADIVLVHGKVLTMNPSQPEVQAVAVRDGRIVAVGNSAEIRSWIGKATQIVDLAGRAVLPGFIDTHVHVSGFGRSLEGINLRHVESIKELQIRLEEHVQKLANGKWITGHGWDQDRLGEKRYPTRWDLDAVSPNNPVVFTRVCGHACVLNSKALALANITSRTDSPSWGQIDKNAATGEPTGVLRESAMNLVWAIMPKPSEKELIEICSRACHRAIETGLTSIHWIVNSSKEVLIIQKLRENHRLPLRVYILFPAELLEQLVGLGLRTGFGDDCVKIGSLKVLVDGSLGARTAALREPYSDEPSTKGMILYTQDELNALVLEAHEAGLQLAIHAIGDKTVNMALSAIEGALAKAPKKDHRHRIEHASVLTRELISAMKRDEVIASVQPHFTVSDFWAVDRVGPRRARWVYPFRSLLTEGMKVTGGSDSPVEPISPLLGIWAAVTRRSSPEERLTVDEALRLYTINAAFASFEEDIKGSIESGKLADLIILSQDPHEVSPEKIKDIEVEMTIVGGQIAHSK
jgi:predicted amidohydrolase YtcJ